MSGDATFWKAILAILATKNCNENIFLRQKFMLWTPHLKRLQYISIGSV